MDQDQTITDILLEFPRFSRLSDESLQWLAQHSTVEQFASGETVFHQGQPCDTFYLIAEGAVKIARNNDQGREVIFGMFDAGNTIGEVVLLDGKPYPANAICTKDALLVTMPRRKYLAAYREVPDFAMATVRDLTIRNRDLWQRILDLGSGSVEDRLLSVLQTLGQNFGEPCSEGTQLPRTLSRQDLANLVCSRYETVIRALKKLEKDGWVIDHGATLVLARSPTAD